MIFNMSGGGAAMNFKVVAYSTEEEILAATPIENTIGIITTTPITSWVFSSEEPSSLTSGMVWISIGTSSHVAFNALKKNTFMVYPLSAKQMVDGELVDRTTKSWQNGSWVEWFNGLYLFQNADYCDDVTGGWIGTANIKSTQEYAMGYVPNVSISNGALLAELTQSPGATGAIHTKNKIDVTKYNTLQFVVDENYCSGNGDLYKTVYGLIATTSGSNGSFVASKTLGNGENGTLTIDISNLSGEYYVAVMLSGFNSKCYTKIKETVLLKQ